MLFAKAMAGFSSLISSSTVIVSFLMCRTKPDFIALTTRSKLSNKKPGEPGVKVCASDGEPPDASVLKNCQ